MLKRCFMLLSLCLMVGIMVSCSNDRISITFDTWDLDEISVDRTDIQVPCDDQTLYFYMNKEAQLNIVAVMNGKVLSLYNSVILKADDPTVVQVTAVSSGFYGVSKRLLVLRPEAREAHLTLTLSSEGRIEKKKIVLVFAERVDLDDYWAIDFDAKEAVTEIQWAAMDEVQRALCDLVFEQNMTSQFSGSLSFPYGYLLFPPHLFAAYNFFPEYHDIPEHENFSYDSLRSPLMFVVESSEGRFYKIRMGGSLVNYIEIIKS